MYLCGEIGASGLPGLATLPMAQRYPPRPTNLLRIPMPKVGSKHYTLTLHRRRQEGRRRGPQGEAEDQDQD